MDSLEWSKTFPILTISRLYLRDQLGFTTEQVQSLTDADMWEIADSLSQLYTNFRFSYRVAKKTEQLLKQKGSPNA